MADYIEQPLAPDGFSQGPDMPRTPENKRRFKRRFIFVFTIVALIVIAVLGWSAYEAYLSPEAQERRAMQENYERGERIIGQLQQQEKADIYGGRTPQETLEMFIEAIRDEDIVLASKYFVGEVMLDENDNPYISKKKWFDALEKAQEEGRLQGIADLVERAEYDPEPSWEVVSFFLTRNNEGDIIADLELLFSEQANIWQIESL